MTPGTLLIMAGMLLMLQPFYDRSRAVTWEAKQRIASILHQAFKTHETPSEMRATIAKIGE